MVFDWIEQAAFNKDKDIRLITCGFIYTWMLKKKQDLNLFTVSISSSNNEEWFNLLTLAIQTGL